jgi:hypothetical protein
MWAISAGRIMDGIGQLLFSAKRTKRWLVFHMVGWRIAFVKSGLR